MSTLLTSDMLPVRQSWGRGALLSFAAHGAIALLAVVTFEKQRINVDSPPAVMLEFAPQIQTAKTQPVVPVGVNQQKQVDASKTQVTPEKSDTHRAVTADEGELALEKPQPPVPRPVKKRHTQRENHLHQQAITGNAKLTSRAAPLPQQQPAIKTAAPIESNAAQVNQQQLRWEGLAMGLLNRMKQFPADARRRGREGVATVTFSVDAAGVVSGVRLRKSSGTIALDREALAMLARASPLPPPPPELLANGRYTVTLPVSFSLKK